MSGLYCVLSGYFACGRGAKYCDERVCMSACLSAGISQKPQSKLREISCTCYLWPWLSSPLMIIEYVMYFRFCQWRHVSYDRPYMAANCEHGANFWCLRLPCFIIATVPYTELRYRGWCYVIFMRTFSWRSYDVSPEDENRHWRPGELEDYFDYREREV